MLQMTSHPPAHPPNPRHRLPTSAAACSRQEQARQVSAAPGGGDHATMHVVVSCRGKSTRPGSRQAKARATQARWARQVHLSPASVGRVRVRRAPAFSSESSSRANASSSAVQRSAAQRAAPGMGAPHAHMHTQSTWEGSRSSKAHTTHSAAVHAPRQAAGEPAPQSLWHTWQPLLCPLCRTLRPRLLVTIRLGAAVCVRRWVATAGPCSQPQQNTCPGLSRNDRCASRQERQWLLLQVKRAAKRRQQQQYTSAAHLHSRGAWRWAWHRASCTCRRQGAGGGHVHGFEVVCGAGVVYVHRCQQLRHESTHVMPEGHTVKLRARRQAEGHTEPRPTARPPTWSPAPGRPPAPPWPGAR